jgi:hypothetical protein
MKKLAILMLGLGLAVGSVTAAFAQDTKKEEKKQPKKKKKSEPTKKEG